MPFKIGITSIAEIDVIPPSLSRFHRVIPPKIIRNNTIWIISYLPYSAIPKNIKDSGRVHSDKGPDFIRIFRILHHDNPSQIKIVLMQVFPFCRWNIQIFWYIWQNEPVHFTINMHISHISNVILRADIWIHCLC